MNKPEEEALESKQPNKSAKEPPVNFSQTQSILQKLQDTLDGEIITFWMSRSANIYQEDVPAMMRLLQGVKSNRKIYILIKSFGGDSLSSLRLVHLLRERFNDITALVISECASAATMLALGSNEIWMSSYAYLSAIDTSVVHDLSPTDQFNYKVSVSLDELTRVIRLWEKSGRDNQTVNPYAELFKYVHPLVMGAVDRSSSLSIKVCTEILSYHMSDKEKAAKISEVLNSEYPAHGYPITPLEAQRIGLPAKSMPKNIEKLLQQLNEEYSEISQICDSDFDENNYHRLETIKIIETVGTRVFYQVDQHKHYRPEERRWTTMHDNSSYHITLEDGKPQKYYIR